MFAVSFGLWLVVLILGVVISMMQPRLPTTIGRAPIWLYWILLPLALAIGLAPLVPSAVDRDVEPATFSTDRAQDHIAAIATKPHPIGSTAIGEVRQYIVSELRRLGLEPETQAVSAPDYYDGSSTPVAVINVTARIEGTASTGAVALVAHFDTVPFTPGANDNASGVAVLLETARNLLTETPLRNDVVLVFTDGEEPAPRYGSTAFVADHRWSEDIRFVINLEAIGTGGPSLLAEVSGPDRWILDHYSTAVPHPAAFSFLTETTELLGGSNTDFAPFRDAGVPGVEFVYALGSSIYHTEDDTPDRVSGRALQSHGTNTLALTRDLATTDLSAMDGHDDMVFFTVGGDRVIRYSASRALLVAVATGLVLTTVLWGWKSWQAVAGGAVMATMTAASMAIVVSGLWMLLAGWRSRMGVTESYAYLVGLAAIVATGMVGLMWRKPGIVGKSRPEDITLVWWLLGLLTALTVPGMSYLFTWPALAGALTLLVALDADRETWRQLLAGAVTMVVTAAVLVPAIDTFFQLAQPRPGNPDSQVLPAIAVPMFLFALAVQLVVAFRVPDNRSPVAAAASRHEPSPSAAHPGAARPERETVAGRRRYPLAPGRQPWDPANGLRIGAATGALIGAGLVALTGISSFWIVAVCGAIGGGFGFWSEKRKQHSSPEPADR